MFNIDVYVTNIQFMVLVSQHMLVTKIAIYVTKSFLFYLTFLFIVLSYLILLSYLL